jgi:hypothetical protein
MGFAAVCTEGNMDYDVMKDRILEEAKRLLKPDSSTA